MKLKSIITVAILSLLTISCKKEKGCEKCQVPLENETSIVIKNTTYNARVKSTDSIKPEFVTISNFKNPNLLNTINAFLTKRKLL
jgi:hypothetical protein